MNKEELVQELAKKTNISQKKAAEVVTSLVESIQTAVSKGKKVTLVGFGTFEVAERAARTGQNPQTGKAIEIPASKAPKFKAGKALKDTVNSAK